jgi:hypothetical protein
MMRRLLLALCLGVAFGSSPAVAQRLSDDAIRQLMIEESLRGYRGNCPCPQSVNAKGRRCGASSAYSKPGGQQPLCYPADVSDKMVGEYRARHGSPR